MTENQEEKKRINLNLEWKKKKGRKKQLKIMKIKMILRIRFKFRGSKGVITKTTIINIIRSIKITIRTSKIRIKEIQSKSKKTGLSQQRCSSIGRI